MKFSLSFQRNEDFMETKTAASRFLFVKQQSFYCILYCCFLILFSQTTFCLSHFQDIDFYVLETEISLSFL